MNGPNIPRTYLSPSELGSIIATKHRSEVMLQLLPDAKADSTLCSVDQASLSALLSKVGAPAIHYAMESASDEALKNIAAVAGESELRKLVPGATTSLIRRLLAATSSSDQHQRVMSAVPREAIPDLIDEMEGAGSRRQRQENQNSEQSQRLELEYRARAEQLKRASDEVDRRTRELEEESRQRVQAKIEEKVPQYVAAALQALDDRESFYRRKAAMWSIQGSLILGIAVIAVSGLSLYGYAFGESVNTMTWPSLLFLTFKGLIILGVLGLWAKHAFTVSNAYMHEAIKRADRMHAINFGKLYLEIYGNTVERNELLAVFENWNIAGDSAFSKASPDTFEPKIVGQANEIMRSLGQVKRNAA